MDDCNNGERRNPTRVLDNILSGRATSIPTTTQNENDPANPIDTQSGLPVNQITENVTNITNVTETNENTATNNTINIDQADANATANADNTFVVPPDGDGDGTGAFDFDQISENSVLPRLISTLRNSFPQLQNRVFGIADLQHLIDQEKGVREFTLYASHLEDRRIGITDDKSKKYQLEHRFAIHAALPVTVTDFRSQFAVDQLKTIRDVLISSLWGYQVAPGFARMVYDGGQFINITGGVAYYEFEFTTVETINRSSFLNPTYYELSLNSLCFCPTEVGAGVSLAFDLDEEQPVGSDDSNTIII